MTAFLHDDVVVAATSAPRLRVVPDPMPTAVPMPKTSKRPDAQWPVPTRWSRERLGCCVFRCASSTPPCGAQV